LSRSSIYLDLADLKLVNLPPEGREGLRTQLQPGDLLVSITADIGMIGYVDSRVPLPAYINQHIALVRCDPSIADTRFLAYFLASERPQRAFRAATDRGAKAGMSLAGVLRIQSAFPPLTQQRAIAVALSDVDALLGGLDRLIAKKRDLKQAAMQQLLTGQTRLPGFHGQWEVQRLGDHVTFLRNGVNSRAELTVDDPVRYLHYGDIHACQKTKLDPSGLPSLPSEKAKSLARLRDGDLVLADASEDLVGVSKSVELCGVGHTELVAGLHTIAARFEKSVLADGFKSYLQFCPEFSGHLRRLAAGTKVYATNRAHVANVEMRLPGVDEQTAIATVLSDMDAELSALEARRDKTHALKQAMMQELLTGKTRLV
jgi:type I restriction enzyme, S subunit